MANNPIGSAGSSDPNITGASQSPEDDIKWNQYSVEDQNVFEYNLEMANFRDSMGGVFSKGYLSGDYSGASMPEDMRAFFAQNSMTLPQNPSHLSKDEHQQIIGSLREQLQGFKDQFEVSGFDPAVGQKMLQAQQFLEQADKLGEYNNINLSKDTLAYMDMYNLPIPGDGQGLSAQQYQEVKDAVGEHMNTVFGDMMTNLQERDPATHDKLEGMLDLRSQLHEMRSGGAVHMPPGVRSQVEALGIDMPRGSSDLTPAEFDYVMDKVTGNVHDIVQRESFKTGFNENMVFSLVMESISKREME